VNPGDQGSARRRHIVVGAGGQGRVVLETWRAMDPDGEFLVVDDDASRHGTELEGAMIVGGVEQLASLGGDVILALGDNRVRLALAASWSARGVAWGVAVHPSAVVSPTARVGGGTVVLPRAVLHTGARAGEHVIVNTGVIVEHDCVLEDGASISPGACMAGRVTVGRGAFVSVGVTIAPRTHIGEGAVVAAGAVVVSDVPAGVMVLGVPARIVRNSLHDFDFKRLL
jgi:sugar O-acyltransferase (sialic acid O-acetyltransferase NeuD family)